MAIRRGYLLRLTAAAVLVGLVFVLAGCGIGGEQNTFAPEGDVARKQRDIFLLALWPAIAILIAVQAVLIYAVIRFRQRQGQGLPKQVHGNTRLEIAWTIAPVFLLAVLAVPMITGIIDLSREPRANAYGEPMQITVIGRQWVWEFQYPDLTDADGNPLTTFTELHIPIGREIGVDLESADVNHSFWVPKLAGKLDAIPGQTNTMWFNALTPGAYSGQCAEFCGLGHTDMRLLIIAESEEEFEAWVSEQLEQ